MNIDLNDLIGENEIFIPDNKNKLDDLFNIKLGNLGQKFINKNSKICNFLIDEKEIDFYMYLLGKEILDLIKIKLKIIISLEELNNKILYMIENYKNKQKKISIYFQEEYKKYIFLILKKLYEKIEKTEEIK